MDQIINFFQTNGAELVACYIVLKRVFEYVTGDGSAKEKLLKIIGWVAKQK